MAWKLFFRLSKIGKNFKITLLPSHLALFYGFTQAKPAEQFERMTLQFRLFATNNSSFDACDQITLKLI